MAAYVGVILGGIGLIAATYVLLTHSNQAGQVATGATSAYGKVARTFQGN